MIYSFGTEKKKKIIIHLVTLLTFKIQISLAEECYYRRNILISYLKKLQMTTYTIILLVIISLFNIHKNDIIYLANYHLIIYDLQSVLTFFHSNTIAACQTEPV